MKNNINKELLSKRLRSLMKNHQETTYSLSKVVNLSPPTISRYASGKMIPKMTTIEVIARYFNVNPQWLAGNSNAIFEEEILEEGPSLTSVPVFESIKYELPILSNKKLDESLSIPLENLSKWGAVIGYQVKDSAMEPYITKGNFVLIRLGKVDLPNNFVALHINGSDLMIRKVIKDDPYIILQPANLAYNASIYNTKKNNIQIIGSVVYIHKEENVII